MNYYQRKRVGTSGGYSQITRFIQFVQLLETNRQSAKDLSERFDICLASVYRYIKLVEDLGYIIEKDFDNQYFIIK